MDNRHRQLGSAAGTPSRLGLASAAAEPKPVPKPTTASSNVSKIVVVAVVLGLCTGFIYLNQERILNNHKGRLAVIPSNSSSLQATAAAAAPGASPVQGTVTTAAAVDGDVSGQPTSGPGTALGAETIWVKADRQGPISPRKPVPLNGTLEAVTNVEVVWQVPPSPVGVWFVAHGCNHGAIDFWPKGPGCSACIGLPEEVNITRELLARGYAVIAISSMDRDTSRCWDASSTVVHGQTSVDTAAVLAVFETVLPRLHLDALPLYAFGASSGGAFVLMLALGEARLAGVAVQISAVRSEDITFYANALKKQKVDEVQKDERLAPLSPTMFVHMTKDHFTAAEVKNDMDALKALGVPTTEIQIEPSPLTPSLLHEAAPDEISEEQSKAIYEALKAKQLLDDKGLLTGDPRHSEWREALKEAKVPGLETMRLEPDESPVSEILNMLYAVHEIVSRTTSEMLDWFESWTAAQTS